MSLAVERLKELLDYDPASGIFTRRVRRHKHEAGGTAGVVGPKGYRRIKIGGKSYAAHRLAVLYMTGSWPVDEVDHINGDKDDNRWCNLHEATRNQNLCNRGVRANSGTGFKGVSYDKRSGKFWAYVTLNKQRKHLGTFATAEQAHAAYVAKAAELHGSFHQH